MMGSKETIISNAYKAKTIQMRNQKRDVIVTYKVQKFDKVVVFVTNYNQNQIPISSYFDLDEIQAVIDRNELIKCCEKAISQGGWNFAFWMK